MTLRTTGFMDVARGMYERMGFHRDPTLDYLVDDGDLLIGYRLSLAPRSCRPDRLLALDPSMEIRELRPEEYEEAGRATVAAWAEYAHPDDPESRPYLQRIADIRDRAGHTLVLGAVEDGRAIGSVTLELDAKVEPDSPRPLAPDTANVRMLGIHPSARRRGAGRALMEACLERARASGKRTVTLHTEHEMHAAQALYWSMGFVRDAGLDRVADDGTVLLGFRLDL